MATNNHSLPLPLAVWLAFDEYTHTTNPTEISVTSLMKSTRNIIANIRLKFPEYFPEELRPTPQLISLVQRDLVDNIPSRLGTAVHSATEHAMLNGGLTNLMKELGYPTKSVENTVINPEPEEKTDGKNVIYVEQRTKKEIDGFVISGQFDYVIDGCLHDIKTTSTFSYTTDANAEKYTLQGSIYRWLNPELITHNKIMINFLFTDFNKNYVFSRDNYPPSRALGKEFPLMSVYDTEQWIRNKLKLVSSYWLTPLAEIPCCTDAELYAGKPVQYKYYKTGYAEGKRSTKNFDSLMEANSYKAQSGGVGEIIADKGKPFYCPFCDLKETVHKVQETKIEYS